MIFLHLLEVSFNRPKLSACASWSANAITFADSNTMNQTASDVFVTKNNTIYAASFGLASVLLWTEGSSNVTRRIFNDLSVSHRIFVTINGDVYADNVYVHSRLEKWTTNETLSTTVMSINGPCGGLFIDVYDNLYCSDTFHSRVLLKPVDGDGSSFFVVAGNSTAGSEPNMLSGPYGIFVDIDLSLYVADYSNHRVQLFRSGQLNGTAVAGNGASGTISLYNPMVVILDADGYLFIAEFGHHRIVGSGPNGFRCIVACTATDGAAADQLFQPRALSFDSYGNLYVADAGNSRIQKFMLAKNSCGEPSDTLSSF